MHSILSSRTSRPVISLLALGSLLLLSGCDLNFWKMTGHQTTMVTAGPVAKSQLDLFYVTCWVTLVIFILVGSVLAYATFKFKARSDADEHAEPPPQSHGNPLVEMSLIAASVLSLVIIAIPTLKGIWYTHDVPEAQAANAYNINATGYQWWFKFEYPAEKLDNGMLLSTGNELVIPAGRPVRIQIRTTDVIHSFWVPKLAGKVDMIPNRGNFLWLQADEGGYFWGQCAEYCGDSHAVMRFRVIALAPMEFAAWVANQKGPARGVVAELKDPYAELYTPKDLEMFNQNTGGFYGGIGMTIVSQDGLITIEKVFPHTPAERAGIRVGDKIVGVDTANVRGWKTDQVSARLKGPPGTQVSARFLRQIGRAHV